MKKEPTPKILCQVCNKEFHPLGYGMHKKGMKHYLKESLQLYKAVVEDPPRMNVRLLNLDSPTHDGIDLVNHPPHYTFGKFEVIDVLEDWFKEDAILYQVGKYLARAGRKGEMLEDLKKAEFYLKRRIIQLEQQ